MYKSKIGGILSIVSGAIGCFFSLIYLVLIVFMSALMKSGMMGIPSEPDGEAIFSIMIAVYAGIFVLMLLVGILAIIGGVYTIRRKNWGLALTGSIAGALVFLPCGIPAIIFTVQGKDEFQTAQGSTVITQ